MTSIAAMIMRIDCCEILLNLLQTLNKPSLDAYRIIVGLWVDVGVIATLC